MIGTLIWIIAVLIIFGVVLWAIQRLLPLIPLAEPFATVINVLIVVISVIIVVWVILVLLGIVSGEPGLPRRL